MELTALVRAHGAERRVADDLPDAAAQLGARHWRRVDSSGDSGRAMSQENVDVVARDVGLFEPCECCFVRVIGYEVKTFGGHTIAVPNAVPADAPGW